MTKTHTACAALVASALTIASAGSVLAAGGHGADGASGKPGQASEASRTIEVTMYDNYYEPENISVKEGETVRFVIRNAGELVHEFNIGTPEMHAKHGEEMALMVEHGVLEPDKINHEAMKMDMGDGKTMEHDDPNSALLEPGDSAEIVWTFPEHATLEYACNIPGHYDSGMVGEVALGH